MKIKVPISKKIAEVAIGQHLIYFKDQKVTSKNFTEIIREYIYGYGESCMDAHLDENENSGVNEKAVKIVNKYYR